MTRRTFTSLATLVLCLGAAVPRAQAPAAPPAVSSPGMTSVAKGTFDVTMAPLAFENAPENAPLARMSIEKTFRGGLAATASGQMVAAFTSVKESAAYSAVELVTGTLDGRSGSFVLQHTGVMHRGAQSLQITVVPDSGTGALAGLSGTMTIRIEGRDHFYEFTYTLPG